MSGREEQEAGKSQRTRFADGASPVRLTVFSLPKPFTDPVTCRLQANAIRSWLALGPGVEVLLLGSEPGIESFAAEHGARHGGSIEVNARGTPLVNSAFAQANRLARGEYLLYCNADVILLDELVGLAEKLGARWPQGFLAIGRRREIALDDELDWTNREQVRQRLAGACRRSSLAPRVCKEYFLFRRGQYASIPAFAVGRGNWDNWVVSESRRTGTPVVDVSRKVRALHQTHRYNHLKQAGGKPTSRWNCYVAGEEARANEQLAGGNRMISGCSSDWLVDSAGRIRRKWLGQWNGDFWLDLPRFLAMGIRLPFQH